MPEPYTFNEMPAALEEFRVTEPFVKWVTEQGFCPDDGWFLIVPKGALDGRKLPEYVRASGVISQPMFIKDVFKL